MLARALTVAAGIAASTATAMGSGVTFTPVLVTGQQAPGMDPGVVISPSVGSAPLIGDGGHIVTAGGVRLAGPGITNLNNFIGYTGLPGALDIFHRGLAPAGSLGTEVLFSNQAGGFKSAPNSVGDFAFMNSLSGAGVDSSNDTVVFLRQGGVTTALFREGSPLPGFTGGEIVANILSNAHRIARMTDGGTLIALAEVSGTANAGNLYAGPVAAPTLQMQWGVAPPGCPEALNSLVTYAIGMDYRFSNTGKFIVMGTLAGAPSASDTAFWVGDSSGVSLWLREGGSLPGLDPLNVVVASGDFGYSINDAGEALAALRLQSGVGDTLSTNDRILVHGTAGSLSVVARENDPVPGLPPDALYNAFTWNAAYNGGILIGASLRGNVTSANDEVILRGLAGSLSVVMRKGDPAPGFPAGYTLGALTTTPQSLQMNKNGHFAVLATVITDIGSSVPAIYASAPGSAPKLVCTWDSLLEVAPGDYRLIERANPSISNPGGISASDQITFVAEFTDGSEASMVANVSFAASSAFASAAPVVVLDTAGTGDGVADPAESMIGLIFPLRNDGSVGATGVTATLTSLTPTVTVQTAAAAFPDIASGAVAGNSTPFVISVDPSHPCGGQMLLSLSVTSNEGSSVLSFLIDTGSNYPACAVFSTSAITIGDSSGNGNGNGIADPGESAIALTIPLTKSGGTGTSTGVNTVLTTTTSTATIVTGASAYPNIGAAATESNSTPFVIALTPSHPCGAPVNLHLSVTADGGLGSAELDFSINGGIPAATAPTARANVGAGVPDNDPNGVTVNFEVSGVAAPISDVDFRFDGTSTTATATSTSTGLGHANVGDLVISLTSPDPDGDGPMTGITVVLANHPGPDSSANNLRLCTFDDAATNPIQTIGSPAGPITGAFQPLEPLSVFDGLSGAAANGTWVLKVADTVTSIGGVAGGQGGFVRNATLLIGNAALCQPSGAASDLCCRGTTCNAVDAGTCTGTVAGSASVVVGSCTGNTIAGCCYADYNHDGVLSIDDLFLYFNAYFTGSPWANMGGDGVESPTIDDLFLYINAYFVGC